MPTISKNKIKYLQSLHRKKNRTQEDIFVVEGEKMAAELLAQHRGEVQEIFALPAWIDSHRELLQSVKHQVVEVSPDDLKKISTLTTPNQVLITVRQLSIDLSLDLSKELSIYIDGIQDPGNMGTILRVADWFGIPYVFCSEDTVEVYNPKVVQASMGAIFRIKIMPISLQKLKNRYADLPIYGTLLSGDNIFTTPLSSNGIIVIGNEGKGISEEVQKLLTHQITIPSFSKNGAESLNVGVATGIVCAIFKGHFNQSVG